MAKKTMILTGGSGKLGKFILSNNENLNLIAPTSSEMNILNKEQILKVIKEQKPEAIVHAAAFTDVKSCEKHFLEAIKVNVQGTINVLEACVENDLSLIFISTDAVFDGEKGNYKPNDLLNPLNKYAKTKTASELIVRTYEKSTVIRTAFFEFDFPYEIAFCDQFTSKDYLDIIGPKILKILENYKSGIFHVGSEKKSMYQIAKQRRPSVKKGYTKDFYFKVPKDTSFDLKEEHGEL